MKLEELPKVGPKTTKLLNKIGIYDVIDLLEYYPYKYNVIRFSNIDNCNIDSNIYVKATIISVVKLSYIRKNFNRLEFIAENNGIVFKVVIFNRAFLKNNLTINKDIVLVGKYNMLNNTFMASDIKFNIVDEKIEAIYHLTDGLTNNTISTIINSAINLNIDINDHIPDYLNKKYNFINKTDAIKKIHNPSDNNDIKISKLKLIYEELFVYMFKINYLKYINKNVLGLKKEFDMNEISEFLASLNFKLTSDQETAIRDILDDMEKPTRMNRLVIGDVGSGKTIVAIVAMLANYLSGYQVAFMVPTEVLAFQHYDTIKDYFKNYNINISLLVGSLKKGEKDKLIDEINNGSVDIVIGTHALLNDNLKFNKLGLVITDEQHRFGVNQRMILQNKGNNGSADVLYLSATPIPRTYALTIYGDLDLSQIKSKPKQRKEVITEVIQEKDIRRCLLKMLEELKLHHQIFVVSPAIHDNEEQDLNSVMKLKEKMCKAFNNKVRIEVLHGKLKQSEKDSLMQEFKDNKINILISTTVIEVGIDVPNATMMVIFNAERFGLATLHQLRGRVGRSNIQSYCFLVTKQDDNRRLKVMKDSNDGFYIAECDFKERGQGDLFGIKQSGDMEFKIADMKRDFNVLQQANIDAKEFINNLEYEKYPYYQEIINLLDFLD